MNIVLQARLERLSVPEPNSGCWLYRGSPGKNGYGTIGIGQKKMLAHRASYEAYVGPIPEGMVVRHRCHTKLCINPEHLSIGTHSPFVRHWNLRGHSIRSIALAFDVPTSEIERAVA